jgi:hypothetical protein
MISDGCASAVNKLLLARSDSQEIARLDAAESVLAHEHLGRIP